MRKALFFIFFVMFLCGVSFAQTSIGPFVDSQGRVLDAYDFENLSVSTTAVGFTAARYDADTVSPTVKAVVCYNDLQPIRFRMDGTNPTSSVGHQLNDKDVVYIQGYDNISDFRAIRQGGTNSNLMCHFLR